MSVDMDALIEALAQKPKLAESDGQKYEGYSLYELIAAAKHLAGSDAVSQTHRGLRFSKIKAPGATSQLEMNE